MATPSKRHMNWTTVTYITSTPTTFTSTGVQSIEIEPGGQVITSSGDADKYPTTIVLNFSEPQITVKLLDLNLLHSLTPGLRGTFSAVHNDAKNGVTASSGGYTLALANAIIVNNPSSGAHKEFGSGDFVMKAESTDGSTNPLSYTAL